MNKLLVVLAGLSLMLVPQSLRAEDMPAAPMMEEAAGAMDTMASEGMDAMDMTADMAEETMDSHVGNKICPISGEEIGSMGEPAEVEYNGKKIKLCCSHCIEAFNKDPEAVMKKIEELAAAEAASAVEAVPAE